MTDEAARRAEEDPIKTAAQCLANKIMALREQRCDTHRHYLCDLCGERWIEEFTLAAMTQAVREEVEGLRKLAALDAETMERYAAEVERLKRCVAHAAYRNHISDGCDGCREVAAALRREEERPHA